MGIVKSTHTALLAGCLVIFAASCYNRPADIPFPASDGGYARPVTKPMHLGAAKKLNWVTVRSGGIKLTIKKLDIDALPATPFDTGDFRPFTRPPEVVKFNWDSLPQHSFSLDSLPSKPINFKTFLLPAAILTKALATRKRTGINLSVQDVGPDQGIQGKVIWGLLRDKAGFLWIGTELGLFRFDGEYTQAYISGDRFRNISGMTQDDKSRLWYINQTGVGRIDPAHGTVDYSTGIASLFVSKMLQDDRGRIWVSYSGKGLAIIDPGRETMKSLDTLTGLAVAIHTDFDGRIGKINVIAQDIGRVMLNLFNNAFFAVAEIQKLRPSGYEPAMSVSTKKVGDKVEIKIKDNGTGIPPKVLEKIFQPFFTTKPTGQGTGLGLSMSYDIIRAHGGEIKVETKEGVGSVFIIFLPLR